MRIRTIHISGFGRWSNLTLADLADFQAFFGQNEAGKSTLKAFILGVLFGYKGRSSQKYEPRSGAAYGGYLDIEISQGTYRIQRMNRTQSELTVVNLVDGQALTDGAGFLNQLFGPLERVDYEQIFAFDAKDLQLVNQLTGPDLEKHLLTYTKPRASKWLVWATDQQKEGSQLFAKQKTGKRPLNLASQAYQHQQESRFNQTQSLNQYLEKGNQVEALQNKVADQDQQLTAIKEELTVAQDLLSYWDLYQETLVLAATGADGGQLVNHPSQKISVEDQDKLQQLALQLDWFNQQLAEANDRRAKLKDGQLANLNQAEIMDVLQELAETSQALKGLLVQIQSADHQVTQFNQQFRGREPKPLDTTDFRLLQERNYWLVGAVVSGALMVGAFSLNLGVSVEGIVAVTTAVTGYLAKRHHDRVAAVMAPFAPWDKETIIAGQYEALLAQDAKKRSSDLGYQAQTLAGHISRRLNQVDSKRFARFQGQESMEDNYQDLLAAVDQASQLYGLNPAAGLKRRVEKDHAADLEHQLYQDRDQVQAQLQKILQQNGLVSLDQLSAALARQNDQTKNEQRLADLYQQIGTERRKRLVKYRSRPALEKAVAALVAEQKSLEFAKEQAIKQVQALQVDQAALVSESQFQDLTQEVANQEARLTEDFGRYLEKSLLPALIQNIFNGQDQDLSTSVQDQAGTYLHRLTLGHYQKMQITEKQVQVFDRDNESFTLAELSTGAADQAYLAVRLALITSLQLTEDLPILVDDAFVNFDENRQAEVLSLLQDLAGERQVLFWTFTNQVAADQEINLGEING
ncbi:hypothetical protein FEFB_11140 [Fructobacillus sp. EFB-N1]|uniref:AAA family ATPase n=1 Tax=Fructobacillus sp. EFB-N1 TaxID=1658766 RepID=UPI00064D855C|nr:AAA family ATPase [Fructobacillus sp. EFB-N1]KMK53186.1 hypothetical protein FEFB_11140 [Fructobacillus sp. EFB-N1]